MYANNSSVLNVFVFKSNLFLATTIERIAHCNFLFPLNGVLVLGHPSQNKKKTYMYMCLFT